MDDEGFDETISPNSSEPEVFGDVNAIPWLRFKQLGDDARAAFALELLEGIPSEVLARVVAQLIPRTKRDFVGKLPMEIAVKILGWTDTVAIARSLRVSKRWYRLASDQAVWRALFHWRFHGSRALKINTLEADWKRIYQNKLTLVRNWSSGNYSHHFLGDHDGNNSHFHSEAIYCLQFDSRRIVSGSRDKSIRVFDANFPHELIHKLQPSKIHSGSILCLHNVGNVLFSGSSDTKICEWDLSTGKFVRVVGSHDGSVLNLKYDAVSGILASCSKDRTIRIWHTADTIQVDLHQENKFALMRDCQIDEGAPPKYLRRILKGHTAAVNAIQLKNNILVSASGDRTLKVWNPHSGALFKTLQSHSRGIACIDFDGSRFIVSGSSDKTIKLWDLESGTVLATLVGHADLVRTVQFCGITGTVISGSYDKTVRVWNCRRVCNIDDDRDSSSNSKSIPATSTDSLVESIMTLEAHRHRVFNVQFDECRIISCSHDQKISIWDFSDGLESRYFASSS